MKSFIVACLSSATVLGVKFEAYGPTGGVDSFFDVGDLTAGVIGQIDSGFEKVGEVNDLISEE